MENKTEKKSFKTTLYQSPYVLILLGVLGFLTGHIIIFGADAFNLSANTPKAVFSEINFTPKCPPKDSLCGKIISFESDSSNKLLIGYLAHDSIAKTRKVKDTLRQNGKLDTVFVLQNYYADTVTQTLISQAVLDKEYRKNYSSDIDFFRRNPTFTLWVVFIIAMVVVWFIAFLPLIYFNSTILKEFGKPNEKYATQTRGYTAFTIAVLLFFHWILIQSFMDSTPFSTFLFLKGFDTRFVAMNILGILAATPVFVGMMHIYKLSSGITASETDKIDRLKEKLKILLLFISINFSFVMVTTALLCNSINKLAFVAKVSTDLKFSPIHNDFVVAYGAVYSILIAIFYIPSAIKIYSLRQEAVAPIATDAQGKGLKFDATIKTVLGEILKSSAPLATSIIASLLGLFFQ